MHFLLNVQKKSFAKLLAPKTSRFDSSAICNSVSAVVQSCCPCQLLSAQVCPKSAECKQKHVFRAVNTLVCIECLLNLFLLHGPLGILFVPTNTRRVVQKKKGWRRKPVNETISASSLYCMQGVGFKQCLLSVTSYNVKRSRGGGEDVCNLLFYRLP